MTMKRWIGYVACLMLASGFACFANEPLPERIAHIKKVRIRSIEGHRFVRLSEYFTGKENTGNRMIVRSQPEERTGMYFILRLDRPVCDIQDASTVRMSMLLPLLAEPIVYEMPFASEKKRTRTVMVGITGSDWKMGGIVPVGWHVGIEDDDGNILAEHSSFLWRMPEEDTTFDAGR